MDNELSMDDFVEEVYTANAKVLQIITDLENSLGEKVFSVQLEHNDNGQTTGVSLKIDISPWAREINHRLPCPHPEISKEEIIYELQRQNIHLLQEIQNLKGGN